MKNPRRRPSDEIPTAPMADLAFLLIVYFLITAVFAATKGLDFALPQEEPEDVEIDPVESVWVEVQPDGSLSVDSRPMALTGLLEYLRPTLRRNPEKPVIVQAAAAASYGAMVTVLDELRQGKERLSLDEEIVIALPTRREWERLGGIY